MFRAFIVDDDEFSVEATYMMFPWEELGISRIDKIYTPVGLLERILTEKPHIVFIDIEMGGITGLDIIEKCKSQGCESLFVIISGHDNFSYAHTAVNLGALYYLLKPLDVDNVEAATKKIKKVLSQVYEYFQPEVQRDLWRQISSYIKKNYSKKLQVQDICQELFISQTTLFNIFKENTNETFVEYLTKVRIEKAKHLLETTTLSVPEVAEKVGIRNHHYFNKVFEKYTGNTALSFKGERGEPSYVQEVEDQN